MTSWWITDLPNWLVAIGTVGAFGTGGVVLLRELNRDREREALAEKQQASSVAAWPIRTESAIESITTIKAQLVINNSSNEPVYNVHIDYHQPTVGQSIVDELQILPPGRYERELPKSLQETWVRTAEGWIMRSAPKSTPTSSPHSEPWNFSFDISFTDSSGRRWRRATDGSLKRE